MKTQIFILFFSAAIVLAFSFAFFNGYSLTGNVIVGANDSVAPLEVSRDVAVRAINDSSAIVVEMKNNNFSTTYMEDKIIEANLVLQQVDYAMVLRNGNSSHLDVLAAEEALRLVSWKNLSYQDVLSITNEIHSRRDKAFEIYDSLSLLGTSLDRAQNKGVDNPEARTFFNSASEAFYQDRYSDAELLIKSARASIDTKSAEVSVLSGLRAATIGFFQKYWPYVLLAVAILVLISYILVKRIGRLILKKKVKKMKTELIVLDDLMKRAQVERFKENKISGLTYNIRMKKYQERMENIKQNLPVFEGKLRK